MKFFGFLRKMAVTFPRLLVIDAAALLVQGVLEATATLALVPLIDLLISSDPSRASVLTRKIAAAVAMIGIQPTVSNWMVIFGVFVVLSGAAQVLATYVTFQTKYAMVRRLLIGTFEDFFHAQWWFFSSGDRGTHINTFSRELQTVGDAFGNLAMLLGVLVRMVFYVAVPFYLSWQVTAVAVACAVALSLPVMLLGRVSYRFGQLNTSTANEMIRVIQESLGSAKVILGFGNQRKSVAQLESAFDHHRQATVRSQTLRVAVPLLYRPLGVAALAVALFAARRFNVPLSETAVILVALVRAVMLMGSLIDFANQGMNSLPSYEQVQRLRGEARRWKQWSGVRPFRGIERAIVLEDVSFRYQDRGTALAGINITIPKGRMIALVGESGAGKSTLVDLVMGLYEPTEGFVKCDGVAIQEFDIGSYRSAIGYVPQESILFNASIRENLFWASETATEEQLARACRRANAEEFIVRFPDGYDTVVGDRGVRLSAGQVQRIALARAILREPALLILDEATSALDTHSERLIQEAMEGIARETTIFMIAHRLSTIINADYIYLLQRGRIVEEGTFQSLVSGDGAFRHMAALQGLVATH